jgi:hypothetical protein
MGCECAVTRNDVTLMVDTVMVAYATIASNCEPMRIADPTDEQLERQRRDSGAFGCRVTYVITNANLNSPDQLHVAAFAAGTFTKTFTPPLAPQQSQTLSIATSTAGGDCRKEAVGQITFVKPDGTPDAAIGGIPVCVGVSRT